MVHPYLLILLQLNVDIACHFRKLCIAVTLPEEVTVTNLQHAGAVRPAIDNLMPVRLAVYITSLKAFVLPCCVIMLAEQWHCSYSLSCYVCFRKLHDGP